MPGDETGSRNVAFSDVSGGDRPALARMSSGILGLNSFTSGGRRADRTASNEEFRRSSSRVESSGWSGFFSTGGGLFGTASGAQTVVARADSFTGPPRRSVPFNLETEDADSVDSGMWGKAGIGCLWQWWRTGPRSNRRRGPHAQQDASGHFVFPVHAVRLGNTVTFLPTPLRNWWGRPQVLRAWLITSLYFGILMIVKLGFYYFLSTSLIIFPTAIGGAALGTWGSIKYTKLRSHIGSFDAAAAVELIKLLALLAMLLTVFSLAAYIAFFLAWALRASACDDKSFKTCNARDMCDNWSVCYATAPTWLTAQVNMILGAMVLSAAIPYFVTSAMVFRRARAASYYLCDNML